MTGWTLWITARSVELITARQVDGRESRWWLAAVAVDEGGQNAIALTLTSDGAAVLAELTEQVVATGLETRLVVKIGDDVLSAVRVVEALQTDVVVVALPTSESPNDVIELVRAR